jgi:hypothetical protein
VASTTHKGLLERPDTPAQWYAAVAGIFLVALGVLSLVIAGVSFGTVGNVGNLPQFILWAVSGWTTIFWIAMGVLALLAVPRLDAARSYALLAGAVFAVFAVWGFIDGNDVMGIFAAGTTDNITHAVLAGLGFLVALAPRKAQRPHEADAASRANGAGRFSRTEQPARDRQALGQR